MHWRRMNANAALACMLVGSITFIVVGELARHGLVSLPLHIDNLQVAILLGTLALIAVGLKSQPSEYELKVFDDIRARRLSDTTIRDILARPDGARELVREYRQVWGIMVLFVIIAGALWGYLFSKLGT